MVFELTTVPVTSAARQTYWPESDCCTLLIDNDGVDTSPFVSLESTFILRMTLSFNHVIEVAVPLVTTQFRAMVVPIVGL